MTPSTELQRPSIKTALPGPKSQEIINADHQYVTPSYPRPDYKLVADHAKGVWITDPDDNVFLDCNAGVAVCSTGHCHPEVVAAIQQQVSELIHHMFNKGKQTANRVKDEVTSAANDVADKAKRTVEDQQRAARSN